MINPSVWYVILILTCFSRWYRLTIKGERYVKQFEFIKFLLTGISTAFFYFITWGILTLIKHIV